MTATSGRVIIGCAGWSVPKSHAEHFPASGSHLERYTTRFSGVEINSSFYRPHRPQTYAKWAASVPEHFRFAVKVPKVITHEHRLIDVEEPLQKFLNEVAELGLRRSRCRFLLFRFAWIIRRTDRVRAAPRVVVHAGGRRVIDEVPGRQGGGGSGVGAGSRRARRLEGPGLLPAARFAHHLPLGLFIGLPAPIGRATSASYCNEPIAFGLVHLRQHRRRCRDGQRAGIGATSFPGSLGLSEGR